MVIDARGNTYWSITGGPVFGYAADGHKLFDAKVDGTIWPYPALGVDGTLYIGTSAGTLYAICG